MAQNENLSKDLRVLTDSHSERIKLESFTQLITDRLRSFLASNYIIEGPASASFATHLRTIGREYAIMRAFCFEVQADNYYRQVRPQLLIRNVSYLVDFFDVRFSFSIEKYRSFLLALIALYFGGSTPENIKAGVGLFVESPINIIELFKFETKKDVAEGAALNTKTVVLNSDGRECFLPFNLNEKYQIDRKTISILDTFKWVVELFVGQNPNEIEFGGIVQPAQSTSQSSRVNVSSLIEIIKPDHTLFDIKNVFEDSIVLPTDTMTATLQTSLEEVLARVCYFTLNNAGSVLTPLPPDPDCGGPVPPPWGFVPKDPSLLTDGSCLSIPFGYRYCCLYLREPPVKDEGFMTVSALIEERKCDNIILNDPNTVLNNDCDFLFAHNPLNDILDELINFTIV